MKEILFKALGDITFDKESVPVKQLKYSGDAKTYITYQLILEQCGLSADNEEQEKIIHFSVDLYTNNSQFDSLVNTIRDKLKLAGFVITNRGPEIYDSDTELYHIVTDVSIENWEED